LAPEEKIKLEHLKNTLSDEVDAVSMNYEIPQDDSRRFISNTTRLRLIKRTAGFIWKGIVHEDITTEEPLEALAMDVPYPAFSCRMGEHFLKSGNLEAAIFWYRSAYSSPPGERYTWSAIDNVYHTWLPHQQLSLCYQALGDMTQAKHHQQWAEFFRKG
jgi:hypothetical protein